MKSIRTSVALIAFIALSCLGQVDPDALLRQAITQQQSGDYAHAADTYRAVLKILPDQLAARSNLGVVLVKLGRYDEAIEEYKAAERISGNDPRIGMNLALAFSKSGRMAEAAQKLEALHHADPNDKHATLLLADCYLQSGEDGRVIDLLEPFSRAEASDLPIAYMLGTAYLKTKRVAEGQQMLDRILRNGDSAEARLLLGTQMFESGDYPAAVQQLAGAIAINPQVPGLLSLYGRALLNTGDADGASAAFHSELAINPNDFEANFGLAQILTVRKKPDAAQPFLDRAKLVRPGVVLKALDQEGPAPVVGLKPGDTAPDFSLPSLAAGKAVAVHDFREKTPVVLVFGSYSCPNFRDSAPALRALYGRFSSDVPFLLVYIREAHGGQNWESTRNVREGISTAPASTLAEKRDHASTCRRSLHLSFPAVVDGMDGAVEQAYSAWPSLAILVGRDGRVKYTTRLTELDFHEADMDAALRAEVRDTVRHSAVSSASHTAK